MKHLFSSIVLLSLSFTSFSQNITTQTPGFVITKAGQQDKPADDFRPHILSFSPMSWLVTGANDTALPAISLSYEYVVEGGKISFYLPLVKGLDRNSFYFSPGIKIYPTGQGPVRYAFGPQFSFGTSMHNQRIYQRTSTTNYYSYSLVYQKVKRTQMAFMINNSLNCTFSKKFYVGFEFGLGIFLYNSVVDEKSDMGGLFDFGPLPPDVDICTQGGLHIGYRL